MVAQAASIVVDEGLISWDTPISSIIPEFQSIDQSLQANCNLTDLFSHRSGLPLANVLSYQAGTSRLVEKRSLLPMVNAMSPAFPFRSSWGYSNSGYLLAGEVLERLTGEPWQAILKRGLFEPLGMRRTTTQAGWKSLPNAAQGFMALEDTSHLAFDAEELDDSTIIGAAGAVCSSVKELILYYRAWMEAYNHQKANLTTSTPGSPFKQVPIVSSAHADLPFPTTPGYTNTTYGLGWLRTCLPGHLSSISENAGLLPSMPIIGRSTTQQQVFYHVGTSAGFYSSVYVLPETDSCIIVLVNTKPLCDSADLIAQLYLEGLLGSPQPHDFVKLTNDCIEAARLRFSNGEQTLSKERVLGTMPKSLKRYCGRYYWTCRDLSMDIELEGSKLILVIQG